MVMRFQSPLVYIIILPVHYLQHIFYIKTMTKHITHTGSTYYTFNRFYLITNGQSYFVGMGAQWVSGRVLDSRPKGRGFEPHRRHCVVVLEQDTFILA